MSKILQGHMHSLLFQVICHLLDIFLARNICRFSLFFGHARWFAKSTLFKLRFLQPFSMYTPGAKLSFS